MRDINELEKIILLESSRERVLDAIRQLPELGSHGSALLGFCFEFGIGLSVDYHKAVEHYLKKAANEGKVLAQARLSRIGSKGYPGIPRGEIDWEHWAKVVNTEYPPEKLLEWLLQYKENVFVQFCLGNCYIMGVGTPIVHNKAIYWYKLAADQGYAPAQSCLGKCYFFGQGTEKDLKASIYWCSLAANQGEPSAQYELGYIYESGSGTSVDMEAAARWYHLAALQNHSEAQFNYGTLLFEGKGVAKDEAQAAEWYHKSALQNNVSAWHCLGLSYWEGKGVAKDLETASYWMMKAVSENYSRAQAALAIYYFNEGHYDTAVCWVEKANDPKEDATHQILAYAYYFGRGKEKDYSKAFHWYKIGAVKGDPIAMHGLARCYEKGAGCETDLAEAARYYELAAEAGNSDAQVRFAFFFETGLGMRRDYKKAIYWYQKAALDDHPEACEALLRLKKLGILK